MMMMINVLDEDSFHFDLTNNLILFKIKAKNLKHKFKKERTIKTTKKN